MSTTPALDALDLLRAGNRRFVAGESSIDPEQQAQQRAQHAEGQSPFAIILGCSDSRAPVEAIFDQGPGELFVIRVAGNVAAATQTGSVEFAAAKLGARLVVVLGHSHCGAIDATLADLRGEASPPSDGLRAIVERIRPGIAHLPDEQADPQQQLALGVRANVEHTRQELRRSSPILQDLAESDGLMIVGAEYSLQSGDVDFFAGIAGS